MLGGRWTPAGVEVRGSRAARAGEGLRLALADGVPVRRRTARAASWNDLRVASVDVSLRTPWECCSASGFSDPSAA